MSPRNIYFPILMRQTPEEFHERIAANPDYASRWARQAAVNGNPEAQLAWGHLLLNGYGTQRDAAAAFRWFRTAARSGIDDAVNMVGRCYDRGWGVPSDAVAATRWFRRAADNGHAWAMYNLGCQYLHGRGAPVDRVRALELFVASARRGNEKAMNKLGRYREEGWGVPVKLASARRWYARAAARGCFRGQFHLARFLAGEGDIEAAVRWLEASLATAPVTFGREIGDVLVLHPDARLAAVGRRALARADGECAASEASLAATKLVMRET